MASDSPRPNDFQAPSLEELAPLFPAYRLEAFIAQGGMGAVYKATQVSLDRPVAIKILPSEFGDDPKFRASFEAEAKAMARLNHPHLISVYDFGDVQGMLYIVMEFVQGKALYYSSHNKAIDPPVALDLVATICRGLGHAHRGGVIHRDIKPANILLDIDAQPKIGDFGLAHTIDRGRDEGLVFGTPGYTAPEVFVDGAEVDARSDIFSVGALLYELISGTRPEPNATSLSTGTDPRIDAIIRRATDPDPARRYADADQLADALEELLPKLSAPRLATGVPSSKLATGMPSPASGLGRPSPSLTTTPRKSGGLALVVVLFILVAGALGTYLVMNGSGEQKSSSQANPSDGAKTLEAGQQPAKPKREPPKKREEPALSKVEKDKPKPLKPKPVVPEKRKESPREALARLAPELREGRREEFPPGTKTTNDSAYFFIKSQMAWELAQQFARRHGAHLAVLSSKEELNWVHENFPRKTAMWLGASDSGFEKKWHWSDGSPVPSSFWKKGSPDNLTTASAMGEDFAALAATKAVLEDHARSKTLPFLLEWSLTGASPTSLEDQLERTKQALAGKRTPVFPPGTYNVGGSRFLLVPREIAWTEARNLAEDAGGHLAVPSNETEAAFLSLILRNALDDGESCWIGGRRNRETPEIWEYLTGEIFEFVQWLEGEPDDSGKIEDRLALKKSGGRLGASDESEQGHKNSHLIIEWSVPALRNMPTLSAQRRSEEDLLAALEEVRDDIREKHRSDYRKYRKERDQIIEDFVEDTISAINNQERLPAPVKARMVEEVKKYREENRLPDDLPRLTPQAIRDDLDEAQEELKELEDDYKEDFQEAKQDYLDELFRRSKRVLKKGEKAKAEIFVLENTVTENDDARMRKILNGDEVPLPKRPEN